MASRKNIFISHVHEDDELLPKLKDLLQRAGMEVRDGSINSDKPNNATNEEYIMRGIIAPRIEWASTLVVLINHDTHESDWVNKEIDYAVRHDKHIVGVFAQGATDADLPEALRRYGDAAIVGWQGDRVVAAINGEISAWDRPNGPSVEPRPPEWPVARYRC